MGSMRRSFVPLLAFSFALGSAAAAPRTIVVCAPGYPGNTEQAKPTMESFARAAERAAGFPAGSLDAIYFETEEAGVARLKDPGSALALVPLPFLLKHGIDLSLTPRLQVVEESGPSQVWTLVAKKGRVPSAASLAGWEVTGVPGYAPGFVRGPVLGEWGALPGDARIIFTSRPLSALRRAAAGEMVAVVLDGPQSAALASLPFAADLEIVARSRPLPGTILCTVGDKLGLDAAAPLIDGLIRLHEKEGGAEILKSMRMARFEKADAASLEAIRRSFSAPPVSGR